jgi:hypothetical protein
VISRSYYQSANPTVIIAFIVLSCWSTLLL